MYDAGAFALRRIAGLKPGIVIALLQTSESGLLQGAGLYH